MCKHLFPVFITMQLNIEIYIKTMPYLLIHLYVVKGDDRASFSYMAKATVSLVPRALIDKKL